MARQTLRIGRDEFLALVDASVRESWLALVRHAMEGGGFPDIDDEHYPIYDAGRLAMAVELMLTFRFLFGMIDGGTKPPKEVIADVLNLDMDNELDMGIINNLLDQVIGSLSNKVKAAEKELDGVSFEEVFGDEQ